MNNNRYTWADLDAANEDDNTYLRRKKSPSVRQAEYHYRTLCKTQDEMTEEFLRNNATHADLDHAGKMVAAAYKRLLDAREGRAKPFEWYMMEEGLAVDDLAPEYIPELP